jgi:hypothetical protein
MPARALRQTTSCHHPQISRIVLMEGLELVDALRIERAKLGDCRTPSLPDLITSTFSKSKELGDL